MHKQGQKLASAASAAKLQLLEVFTPVLTQTGRSDIITCEAAPPNHIKGSVHKNNKNRAEVK